MKLYELSDAYTALFEMLDEETEMNEWSAALENIQDEFEEKAANTACYIKNLEAEAEAIKAEETELAQRRKQKEKTAERLKTYLLGEMVRVGNPKIDKPRVKITIRNNPEKVNIVNSEGLIDWAMKEHDEILKYLPPEISKTGVKSLIKSGVAVPYTQLEKTQSLIIK